MTYTTLLSTAELAAHLDDPHWVIIDARFNLREPEQGRQAYLAGHVPGALYADLNQDLSSRPIPGQTGRHPLPDVAAFAATLSRWGIDHGVQVVVYDDASGFYAGRLWWMLQWMGHDAVAVLNGGWTQWQKVARPIRAGAEQRTPRPFVTHLRPELMVDAATIQARLGHADLAMFDARTADRYRGENETLDPVGGHIPGAHSAPYTGNLDADGLMLPPERLRARFAALLGNTPVEEAIFYCGSGVSVMSDVIAVRHAGLGMPKVYIGSWSDWVSDPARPIAVGDKP